jgi:zinc transport system ATP-binding protein
MTAPLLEVENLCVRYGGHDVLENVTLAVRRGSFSSLIGPNGAGKSTLLKSIVGLVQPNAGVIRVNTKKVGYVPQQLPLDPALPVTVAEFLSLRLSSGNTWFGATEAQKSGPIRKRLEEIGAGHLIERRLGRLSGGEFQRVLIASALLNEPELLLLDEPLTGVDIRGGLSFDGLLHHLHDHRGITILMVSHDLHLVEHLSDEVFCINRDMCCHGNPNEVLKPENLARAYGHLPGMVSGRDGTAFIPISSIH